MKSAVKRTTAVLIISAKRREATSTGVCQKVPGGKAPPFASLCKAEKLKTF